jgi:hypothetical protein
MRIFVYFLWINLWIKRGSFVDKVVETSVDNSGLWIIHDLSTALPQENAIYPQFCAQPRGRIFGLPMGFLDFIPIIHRPYYYYYSKNLMV